MTAGAGDLGMRCACRSGCLAWLRRGDDLVVTTSGAVLAQHLPESQRPPRDVALTFNLTEVTTP